MLRFFATLTVLACGVCLPEAIAAEPNTGDHPAVTRIGKNGKGTPAPSAFALSPDGNLIAVAYEDGRIELIRLNDRQVVKTLQLTEAFIGSIAFSPDGKRLASHVDNESRVIVREIETGKVVEGYKVSDDALAVVQILFSKGGDMLVGRDDYGMVYVWDRKRQNLLWKRDLYAGSISWSPDGKYLALGKNSLQFLDPATGKLAREAAGMQGSVSGVDFRPDGSSIIVADTSCRGSTLRIWNTEALNETIAVIDLGQHVSHFASVVFTPDGNMFISSDADGTIRFFDAGSQSQLKALPKLQRGGFEHLEVTSDGKTLVVGGIDKPGVIWLVEIARVFQ